MSFVRIQMGPDVYAYRFACQRCGAQVPDLNMLRVVECGPKYANGLHGSSILCPDCHELAGTARFAWHPLPVALVQALSPRLSDDDLAAFERMIDPASDAANLF